MVLICFQFCVRSCPNIKSACFFLAEKNEWCKPQRTVGALDGYSYNENPSRVYKEVEASGADILFVATGAPRQEDWIAKYANLTSVKVAIGVGGLFDFYSESVSRAPIWLREFSLEWVWRLLMQPRQKAYRYLVGNPLFLYRVLFSHVNKTTSRNVLEVA